MKIGITKEDKPEKKKGKLFEYRIWFRTSDGKLRSLTATRDVELHDIIDTIGGAESKVKMLKTGDETDTETFLEAI